MPQPKAAFYEGNRTVSTGTCTPVDPGPGEVQIRVSHCGICGTDLHIFHGAMDQRVKMPAVLGHEMSGEISAVGAGVEGWATGDPVTVMPLDPGPALPEREKGYWHIASTLKFMGIDTPGAFQEFWTVPAKTLFRLPPKLSLEHGALIEPLAVACHDVRMGEVQPGEKAVVIGGGPIGLVNALVARHAGAEVVMAEVNPYRVEFLRELGFACVNPRVENLQQHVLDWTDGAGADVVFEVSGSSAGAAAMTELCRIRGRVVLVAVFAHKPEVDLFRFFWRELKLQGARVYETEDYQQAIDLAASGALPLDRIITETTALDGLQGGFEKMDSGGACMKILVDCRG